jgi:hypothetical protein
MQQAFYSMAGAPAPFPVIRATLKNKRLVGLSGAVGMGALVAWLAFRTGFVELYPIAIVLGFAAHRLLKVALEVIELVAETLMPR